MTAGIAPRDVAQVHQIIAPYIRRTPVLETSGGDVSLDEFPLFLKLEFMQHSGSFKVRGAFTHLLTRELPKAGVVAASGGNHGVAVAHAARRVGIPATIFVPTVASPAKIARIKSSGATIVISGDRYADALEASERFLAQSQAISIHAYDQRETLLGQATLGRELQDQVPDLETLLVAVGGGGLIGGVASWYEGRGIRIIGVEPAAAPTMTEAFRAGRPVDAPANGIAADSLAPRRVGELTYPIARTLVDRILLVEEEEIRRAQEWLWEIYRLAVEPGGAAAMAALLSRRYRPAAGERVGVILCGANTER